MPVSPAPVRPADITTNPSAGGGAIPWREATQERVEILPSSAGTVTAVAQRIEVPVDGVGYMYGIVLSSVFTAAANAANVAYNEDAPWNVFDSVVLRDVNGEIYNTGGFGLYLANLVNHDYASRLWDASTNTNLFSLVAGNAATGGSFTTTLRIPVANNRRDMRGIVGNQDRSQTYLLRHDITASGNVYATAPTALPTFTINKFYESYMVPQAQGPNGPQEIYPPEYGTLRFTTETVSDAAPAPGQVNHYLRRIGQTIRWIALTFRSNSSRATAMANANAPTNIRFKIGDETLFNESFNYRRALMFERYGYEFPDGVLVYETLHDFSPVAGFEMGDDYLHTAFAVNSQFQITYPAGFGNTANSLTFTTDDMVLAA